MVKIKAAQKDTSAAVDLLNQILVLEYSLIVHYPRLASRIRDQEIRSSVLKLGTDSVGHADTVARAITSLGGTPHWSLEAFPEDMDLNSIFRAQLEKEQTAARMHHQSLDLVDDPSLVRRLREIAEEEHVHVRTVNEILAKLARQGENGSQDPLIRPNPFF